MVAGLPSHSMRVLLYHENVCVRQSAGHVIVYRIRQVLALQFGYLGKVAVARNEDDALDPRILYQFQHPLSGRWEMSPVFEGVLV